MMSRGKSNLLPWQKKLEEFLELLVDLEKAV